VADNKLELVITVDADKANASIKSVNAGLSSLETTAVSAARGASRSIDGMTAAMVKGATAGNLLANAIQRALGWAKEFTVGSVMLAAENAKAEAGVRAMAQAHGASAAAAARHVAAIEQIGFEYTEAAQAVKRFLIADLDLSKAEGLAKLAKDAAAIQNVAAGEALEQIVTAIESGYSRGLRALGIFVNFEREALAEQLRLGRALTEAEEKQVRYNAVLRERAKIQGAHAAIIGTAEGQLGALRREFQNLREEIGARFQEDLKALIGHLRALVGWLRENADALVKFAQVAATVGAAFATYKLADRVLALAHSIAALNLATLNPYALLGAAAVGAGLAVYAQWKRGQEEVEARFTELERRALRMQLLAGKTSVEELRRRGMTDEQLRELVAGRREETFEVPGPKIALATGPDLETLKRAAEIRKRQAEVERESARALEEARRRGLAGFARDMAEVQEQIRKWTTFVDERGTEQRIALTRAAWENVIEELRVRLANWQKEVQETNRKNLAEYLAAEEEAARRRMDFDAQVFAQRLAHNEEIARRNLDHLEQMLAMEEQRASIARDAELRALEGVNAQTLEQKLALEQRKAAIEIEYLERVHQIRMRLFDLETSRMVLEEEAQLKRLGYRAEEIQARIAELTQQREAIREAQQEVTNAAVQAARENAAIRQAQLIRDQNQRIFDSLKRQAEGVFDALLTRSQSVWSSIANSLKTALLTAIKEVVTSHVAAMLMRLFTGARVSFAGGAGGLLGLGAVPIFGAGSITGGPGGTGGFAGPVQTSGGFSGGLGLLAGLRANLPLLGATGSLLGLTGAFRLGQRGGVGAALAPAIGAVSGLVGFGALTSMFPALVAAGPVGWIAAAGVGAFTGLLGLFRKSAEQKAREKIKATYGVDVREKGVLRQIVELAKQGFGGNLDAAIRSQPVRDLIELYAMTTGQSTAGLPPTMRPVLLLQQGGALYQQGATLDRIPAGTPQSAAPIVINITVPGAKEFFEKETLRVVVDNPRSVQSAAMTATRASAGRREMLALQLSPGTLTA
jgi:Holliday junction resolvasome RuvABC DNA-binding subunit